MTSSEAVRTVLGNESEAGLSMCDKVEEQLASWETKVGGLVRERLRLGGVLEDGIIQAWLDTRLDKYYSVSFLAVFIELFGTLKGSIMTYYESLIYSEIIESLTKNLS